MSGFYRHRREANFDQHTPCKHYSKFFFSIFIRSSGTWLERAWAMARLSDSGTSFE
jgi:hypothetical protein